jgi:hypothetical protein
LDAVSNLLEKVLATAGAHKPSRDSVDKRVVKSVHDKTGTARVKTTGPPEGTHNFPDSERGAAYDFLDKFLKRG